MTPEGPRPSRAGALLSSGCPFPGAGEGRGESHRRLLRKRFAVGPAGIAKEGREGVQQRSECTPLRRSPGAGSTALVEETARTQTLLPACEGTKGRTHARHTPRAPRPQARRPRSPFARTRERGTPGSSSVRPLQVPGPAPARQWSASSGRPAQASWLARAHVARSLHPQILADTVLTHRARGSGTDAKGNLGSSPRGRSVRGLLRGPGLRKAGEVTPEASGELRCRRELGEFTGFPRTRPHPLRRGFLHQRGDRTQPPGPPEKGGGRTAGGREPLRASWRAGKG